MFCGRLNKLKFLLLLHFFTVISVLCFIKKVYASDIEFSLDSLPNASNGYGGVSIDLNLSGIKNKDYTYEIKRSSDGIYWQNIGLGFEYNKHDSAVYPHKICLKGPRMLSK